MTIPLKVLDPRRLLSEALSEHIRDRTEKLAHFFSQIRSCRVTVDGPGDHPLQGRIRVRVSIRVPGVQIAINKQSGADLPMAIRESFDAADQRLEDHARITRESLKSAKRRPKQRD